jgi:hypothetical protein
MPRAERRRPMTAFKVGDHVRWKSEAGRVSGRIIKRITADILWKGYTHHATRDEPQYVIKSDRTDHLAIHKGSALTRCRRPAAGGRAAQPRGE